MATKIYVDKVGETPPDEKSHRKSSHRTSARKP